jgi:hypothetical protein
VENPTISGCIIVNPSIGIGNVNFGIAGICLDDVANCELLPKGMYANALCRSLLT